MTLSTETTSVSYTGNGSTTSFPVTFPFYEIEVYEVASGGIRTDKTEGSHYTVTGGAGATGSIEMLVAPASGVTLRIRRITARTQLTDYTENDDFPAEAHEKALDRLTMIAQEIGQRSNFNPTFGAYDGSLGTHTALAHYARMGDYVFFRARGIFTSIGTATGYLTCSLPVTAHALGVIGTGRNMTTGALLTLFGVTQNSIGVAKTSDGAFPAVNGDEIHIATDYFAA